MRGSEGSAASRPTQTLGQKDINIWGELGQGHPIRLADLKSINLRALEGLSMSISQGLDSRNESSDLLADILCTVRLSFAAANCGSEYVMCYVTAGVPNVL